MTGSMGRAVRGDAVAARSADQRTSMVEVCGQRLRVVVRPGIGRPLLLCNGIGAALELLDPFVAELDPAIPVIRFDVPGIGGSPAARLPYTLASLTVLLDRLLDQLGYDEVDVLGISWGGSLAQQFALQNPRRCRRLVLVGTSTGVLTVPGRLSVLARLLTPRRHRDVDYAVANAADLYGGRLREEPERVRELLYNHDLAASGRGYLMQLLAASSWTSLPFLGLIRQPTLIMAGSDDPIIPVINARIMHTLLPNSTLHVYPDGHLALISSAADLAPIVADFLHADPTASADTEQASLVG